LDVFDAEHKLSKFCDGTSEVRFDLTGFKNPVRNATLEWLGIEKNEFEKIKRIPLMIEDLHPEEFTKRTIKEMSRVDDDKCIYLENPFYLMNWNKYKTESISPYDLSMQRGKDIIKATRRPQRVQKIARDILKILDINKYAALHWRYDEDDFLKKQEQKAPSQMRSNIRYIRKNPNLLCQAITKLLKEMNITNLLIFSPPSDQEFVSHFKKSLSPLIVITDAEFQESMENNGFEELLPFEFSLVSQELSYLSDLFIWSEISSWSGNVHMERYTDGKIENYSNIGLTVPLIFESVQNMMKASILRNRALANHALAHQALANRNHGS